MNVFMPLVGKLEKQLNEEQTQIIQKLQKYKYDSNYHWFQLIG